MGRKRTDSETYEKDAFIMRLNRAGYIVDSRCEETVGMEILYATEENDARAERGTDNERMEAEMSHRVKMSIHNTRCQRIEPEPDGVNTSGLTDEQKQDIDYLLKEDHGLGWIAKEVGTSVTKVSSYIARKRLDRKAAEYARSQEAQAEESAEDAGDGDASC